MAAVVVWLCTRAGLNPRGPCRTSAPPRPPNTKTDSWFTSSLFTDKTHHSTQKAESKQQKSGERKPRPSLAPLHLCQWEVPPLFFDVPILFLVGRGIVFLEAARPPDCEISPSWGWPKRKQVVYYYFFKTPVSIGFNYSTKTS